MTGRRLARRIGFTLALSAGLCLFLTAIDAQATPIQPDIKKLISQPQQDSLSDLGPARAGWDGPEMVRTRLSSSTGLEVYDSAATAAWRASLAAAATPDPGAVLGIVMLIFLLRILRSRDQQRHAAASASMEDNPERLAA